VQNAPPFFKPETDVNVTLLKMWNGHAKGKMLDLGAGQATELIRRQIAEEAQEPATDAPSDITAGAEKTPLLPVVPQRANAIPAPGKSSKSKFTFARN
jgi:hypothetical protein